MTSGTNFEDQILALAKEDGVIVIPTDSSYRIVCRLDRPRAIDRVYSLAYRDRTSSLVILGASPDSLLELITGDLTKAILLANRFWPGLVTVVGRASDRVPAALLGPGFKYELTVAVRMPQHDIALNILNQLPGLAVASAGITLPSKEAAATFEELTELIGSTVDYIVPDTSERSQRRHSTVVDIVENPPQILRVGEVSSADVLGCLSAGDHQ